MQTPDFIQTQIDFAARVHNPQQNNISDNRGAKLYAELVHTNISRILANAFPVTHSILSAEQHPSPPHVNPNRQNTTY